MARKFGTFKPRASRFKEFDFKVPKTKNAFKKIVRENAKLSKAVHKIFNKKTLMVVGAGAALGYGIDRIWDYVESNSGCFKKQGGDDSVCKVRELSCCQPKDSDNVGFCQGFENAYRNACQGFDEDAEGSCCKFCDCVTLNCGPGEEVRCQRPTVADALTHFTKTLGSGVWSALTAVFPWLPYVLYAIAAVAFVWILNLAKPYVWKKQEHVRKTGTLLPTSGRSVERIE